LFQDGNIPTAEKSREMVAQELERLGQEIQQTTRAAGEGTRALQERR